MDSGVRGSPRRRIVLRVLSLVAAGVALYVFGPTLLAFVADAPLLLRIEPLWFPVLVATQAASFVALWQLHHVALRCDDRVVVATSQLASNAFSRIVPGGAAAAGALQFRMLVQGGVSPASAATGVTAVGVITVGTLFALPILAVPAVLAGAPVAGGLWQAAVIGGAAFLVLFGVGLAVMTGDRLLRAIARAVRGVAVRLGRAEPPAPGDDVAAALIAQRDDVRAALGQRWRQAVAAAVGNRLLDYASLLIALTAVGAAPRASLVLLAYVAATVLAMIPITPGGLGFVEAGLAAMLRLAGVPAPESVLATLAYRLVTYWLPLPAGAVAYWVFRRRIARGAVSPA
ncbi:MAG TPA: lysylphosphatidylglycerol synthase transmembrane domain-containing protein [Actinomycetota bacterium]|nr:lysylphosphatidylglycerol synthase transmembrane domain-containing protein [Actinomycetota bacterium]